jgi:hypothetical protein
VRRRSVARCVASVSALLCVACIAVALHAATSRAQDARSKADAIRELLAIAGVAGVSEQMLEQQSAIELMRIRPLYASMMELAVSEQADLRESQREQLRERLADFEAFGARFRSLFVERVNFSQIIESAYTPLYERYFSEQELAQMLAFYRTPVGRKSIEVMPSLLAEAARGIDEALRPLSVALIQQIVAEERARLGN